MEMHIERIDENSNINCVMCIVTIIFDVPIKNSNVEKTKGITRYCDAEILTLKQCYEIAKKRGYKNGVITVLSESLFDGCLYKYGNHGNYWERVGKTAGYA